MVDDEPGHQLEVRGFVRLVGEFRQHVVAGLLVKQSGKAAFGPVDRESHISQ